jgi:uncharacterized protein
VDDGRDDVRWAPTVVAAIAVLLFGATLAEAASFDCAKAATPHEKLVCGDPALSSADEHLAASFQAAIATL